MRAVHRRIIEIGSNSSGAPDTGGDDNLFGVEFERQNRIGERPGGNAVRTAGTPQGFGRAEMTANFCRGMAADRRQIIVARRSLQAFLVNERSDCRTPL